MQSKAGVYWVLPVNNDREVRFLNIGMMDDLMDFSKWMYNIDKDHGFIYVGW